MPHQTVQDPFDRSPVVPDRGVPRYVAVKWLAHLFKASGAAQMVVGLIGLSITAANPILAWAFDPATADLARTKTNHAAQKAEESSAITQMDAMLQNAHVDAHEMLQDRIGELRATSARNDAVRGAELLPLTKAVESAGARRDAMWRALWSSFGWAHGVVIAGLVSLAIGQMIAAFRDMAINSYLRNG